MSEQPVTNSHTADPPSLPPYTRTINMDALPRNAIIAITNHNNIPAVLHTIFTCKHVDPKEVFFVGWFLGFDEIVANTANDMFAFPCKTSPDVNTLAGIMYMQQHASILGLERRRVLVVIHADMCQDIHAELFLNGKQTLDIFPVVIQGHTNRVWSADVVAVDQSSFTVATPDSTLCDPDVSLQLVHDDELVFVCEFQNTAAIQNTIRENESEAVREVIVSGGTKPRRTTRKKRTKTDP
jgi:hypothetical protein